MIYFTQDSVTLHVKIGHTNGDDAETRRKALQTGNSSELVVLATMPGERADEAKLHQRFATARVAGEWFKPVPELLLLICQAAPTPPPPRGSDEGAPLRLFGAGSSLDGPCVLCPVCGFDYTHVAGAHTRVGSDGGEAVVYPGTQPGGRTSHRRSALVVCFRGECGHSFALVVQQHKGINFVTVEASP